MKMGIVTHVVQMLLYALYLLAEGLDLGLWVLGHDGTIASIEEVFFP
jgi:hypothetical protein